MTYTKRYQLGGIDLRPEARLTDPQTAKVRCNLIKNSSGRNVLRPGCEIRLIGSRARSTIPVFDLCPPTGQGPMCGVATYTRDDLRTNSYLESLCLFNENLEIVEETTLPVISNSYYNTSFSLTKTRAGLIGEDQGWALTGGYPSEVYSIQPALMRDGIYYTPTAGTSLLSLGAMIAAENPENTLVYAAAHSLLPAACAWSTSDRDTPMFIPARASYYFVGAEENPDFETANGYSLKDWCESNYYSARWDRRDGRRLNVAYATPHILFRDILYFVDSGRLMKYDGANVTYAGIGNQIVDTSVSLTKESVGSLSAGAYNYTMTFSRKDHQGYTIESDPYYSASLTVGAGEKIVLSMTGLATAWVPPRVPTSDDSIYGSAGTLVPADQKWGATVNGTQSATTQVYCDGGYAIGGSTMNNLDAGDTVYLYDHATSSYVERYVHVRTNSYIEFLNSSENEVTVSDNEDISPNVHVNLYRSKVGPSSLNYFVNKIPYSMGTTIYRDSAADASLGIPYYPPAVSHSAFPHRDDSYPRITALGSYRGLLIVGDGKKVYYSDIDDPEYFPPDNYFTINAQGGERIRGFFVQENFFYVFLDESIYVVTGDLSSAQYNVDKISESIGTPSALSIVEIDRKCYFANSRGAFILEEGGYPQLLSEPIDFIWKKISADSPDYPINFVAHHDKENQLYVVFLDFDLDQFGRGRTFAYSYARKEWYRYDYYLPETATRRNWLNGGSTSSYRNLPFSRGGTKYNGENYLADYRATEEEVSVLYRITKNGFDDATPIPWAYESNKETMEDWSVYKKALRLVPITKDLDGDPFYGKDYSVGVYEDISAFSYTATMEGAVLTATGYATAAGSVPSFHKIAEGKFKDLSFRLDALNTNYTENTEPVINFVDIEYEEPYDKKIKK